MVPTYTIPYRDGELRIGWASWDKGAYKERSIKYAYPDSSGKISRGSPELPFDILIDMLLLAADQKELDQHTQKLTRAPSGRPLDQVTVQELQDEKKSLTMALMRLQQLAAEVRWVDWATVYDPIGSRLEAVKEELDLRKASGRRGAL